MLFSNDQIAAFINTHFEPTWEKVRDVPMVRIDFGGGHVITRTLNGNVATYVCTAKGETLDILPGIYEPKTYLARLEEFVTLFQYLQQNQWTRHSLWNNYHQRQAAALKAGRPREVFIEKDVSRISISRVENAIKLVLQPASRLAVRSGRIRPNTPTADGAKLTSAADLAGWQALAEDTRLNETLRCQQIHEYLAAQRQFAGPTDLTKWLYREVLHADLDDPYLGLGKVLFASYPFAEEETSDR